MLVQQLPSLLHMITTRQVDEWRRLLQLQLQATESLRDSMDPFEALKPGELCADSIAQSLAPKRLRKSGEVAPKLR